MCAGPCLREMYTRADGVGKAIWKSQNPGLKSLHCSPTYYALPFCIVSVVIAEDFDWSLPLLESNAFHQM